MAFYLNYATILSMKTVVKIDPEKEYETAKKFIKLAGEKILPKDYFQHCLKDHVSLLQRDTVLIRIMNV